MFLGRARSIVLRGPNVHTVPSSFGKLLIQGFMPNVGKMFHNIAYAACKLGQIGLILSKKSTKSRDKKISRGMCTLTYSRTGNSSQTLKGKLCLIALNNKLDCRTFLLFSWVAYLFTSEVYCNFIRRKTPSMQYETKKRTTPNILESWYIAEVFVCTESNLMIFHENVLLFVYLLESW